MVVYRVVGGCIDPPTTEGGERGEYASILQPLSFFEFSYLVTTMGSLAHLRLRKAYIFS